MNRKSIPLQVTSLAFLIFIVPFVDGADQPATAPESKLQSDVNAKEAKSLIIYRIGKVPIEMREGDAYGIMLVNDGREEDPGPRYILAIAKTRHL